MKSDVFMLNSDAGRMAAARYATEEFARALGLEKHDALRLDLLTEETLGMVKALVEEFTASSGLRARTGAARSTCRPRRT